MPETTPVPWNEFSTPAPGLSAREAESVAERLFGVAGLATPLVSERDQNFRITEGTGRAFVLKVANPGEHRAIAEMQVEALLHLGRVDPELPVPRVRPTLEGGALASVPAPGNATYTVRMVTFLEGVTKGARELAPSALFSLGRVTAELGRGLRGFFHPAAGRSLIWDVQRTADLLPLLGEVEDQERRATIARVLERFSNRVAPALARLRAQVIHGDVQPDNVVFPAADAGARVAGVIDFGDLVHAPLVCDLAVTAASTTYGREDPFAAARAALEGYVSVTPLEALELELLPDLVACRLAAWILIAAWRSGRHRENVPYIVNGVSEAWEALRLFDRLGAAELASRLRSRSTGGREAPAGAQGAHRLVARRLAVLGPTLRLSYDEPLHLVRGEGVWLYDPEGRAYLDAYNNVPVVGHAHPRVVDALSRQARLLNTNTRYLHASVVELAERLRATMPPGVDTCFFVNSGSEANDAAWRIAREATGQRGGIVTGCAYHGVTVAAAELSPEEWPSDHRPAQVATIPAPDGYRGRHRRETGDWAERYAAHLDDAVLELRARNSSPALVCIDAAFASDGILPAPASYLHELGKRIRAAGGLFVADEVQAGFGRSGDSFWGFAASGFTPDFVTLGKPMGNGHPVAAVFTRAAIAEAFAARYPEFFSTFGGNTVSAAVALAVLDVIEEEGLQQNARRVGGRLLESLRGLARRHPWIGDVRGAGLLIGVELVRDRSTREPASEEAAAVVNAMRRRQVLVGRCGPDRNVLKIRPPLVFEQSHSDLLLEALDACLAALQPPVPRGA